MLEVVLDNVIVFQNAFIRVVIRCALVRVVISFSFSLLAVDLKDHLLHKLKIPDMKNKLRSTTTVIKEKVNGINMVALMEDTWQTLK